MVKYFQCKYANMSHNIKCKKEVIPFHHPNHLKIINQFQNFLIKNYISQNNEFTHRDGTVDQICSSTRNCYPNSFFESWRYFDMHIEIMILLHRYSLHFDIYISEDWNFNFNYTVK